MAIKKKKSIKPTVKKKEASPFLIPLEKKKKILGVTMIVLALLLFLSILSYSRVDEANLTGFLDIFRVFSSDADIVKKMVEIHNWLGIFGAYTSYFFINSTLGYFSLVFPVMLFIWGYSVVRNQTYKLIVYVSNFLLALAVILSSFFGLLRFQLGIFTDVNELSGNVGGFFGTAIGRLLGGLGGTIFLSALLFLSLFIVFDFTFGGVSNFVKKMLGMNGEDGISVNKAKGEKSEGNLDKIKNLRKRKSKKSVEQNPKQENPLLGNQPEIFSDKEDTRITILKPDGEGIIDLTNEPSKKKKNSSAKENTKPQKEKQIDDDILPEIDVVHESVLPEQWEEEINFEPPTIELLSKPSAEDIKIPEDELKHNAELLKQKLQLFDIKIEDISVTPGPVVTLYEIVPSPGVKISRIVSLENDIALALAARGIRIIAPIPGKSAIGVEIPNAKPALVSAYSVLAKISLSKAELPLALGKTISGDIYITDLATMPHLLIAGSTGSGKSVGINMIITSLLFAKHPSEIKFVIVDPKKIELSFYRKLNKHYLAISPDLDEEIITMPQNALLALKAVEYEMDKRYDKLAKVGVRNIVDYNKKIKNPKTKPMDTDKMKHYKMPYIITVIDELADLMMTSGKEVEEPITRIAQLARAVGIHLIVATQRPSVNVITGTIKANFGARIAYQAASRIDSRTILDMKGAEQLLGRGDMLFLPGGMPKPVRIQNAFISTEEVEKITNFIYVQEGYSKRFFLPSMFEKKSRGSGSLLADVDPMFNEAAEVIVRHQQGSVSLLQRRLKLGYARAARIVDQLEEAGVVGPSMGSKARDVLVENEDQLDAILRSL